MNNEASKSVLVIDDAVTVRMYHRATIEAIGYQVEEAENGLEALEKALQTHYDLFLVDINMPKMDGYALVREMRKTETLAGIPVVMISTEAQSQDEDRAYEAGANFYIIKPTKQAELQNIVRVLIGD